MTTAPGDLAQPDQVPPKHLHYTRDRHEALLLVSRNKIVSVGGLLRRRDGADLELGAFASLLALQHAGYVEAHEPPAGNHAGGQRWPVRLSMIGTQLLSRFNLEHADHGSGATSFDRTG